MVLKIKVKKERCPICNGVLMTSDDHIDNIITESSFFCPKCGYYYEFMYGAERMFVGSKCFHWDYTYHWSKNKSKLKSIYKKIDQAVLIGRRRWKKYHKGCTAKEDLY